MTSELTTIEPRNEMLAMMERLATTPNMNVDVLKQMMDLQERILDRNAKSEYAADFAAMRPLLPRVFKASHNIQTKSNYAKLDDINTAIDPILAKYGFATSAKIVAQTEKDVTVKAELLHRSGHIESSTITIPLDDRGIAGTKNKTEPHAISSSVTYAKRIAICALLNISTGDDKDGNLDAKPITHPQELELDNLMDETGTDKKKFLYTYFGLDEDDLLLMPVTDFERAKALLTAKKKANKNG